MCRPSRTLLTVEPPTTEAEILAASPRFVRNCSGVHRPSVPGGAAVCYRKLDGTWLVTHEQSSVPFDVESGKASLDLTP